MKAQLYDKGLIRVPKKKRPESTLSGSGTAPQRKTPSRRETAKKKGRKRQKRHQKKRQGASPCMHEIAKKDNGDYPAPTSVVLRKNGVRGTCKGHGKKKVKKKTTLSANDPNNPTKKARHPSRDRRQRIRPANRNKIRRDLEKNKKKKPTDVGTNDHKGEGRQRTSPKEWRRGRTGKTQ